MCGRNWTDGDRPSNDLSRPTLKLGRESLIVSSADDFRSLRRLLPDEAFALVDKGEDPPLAVIPEIPWRGLMALPDDVVLRTTGHQGPLAEHCWDVFGECVKVILARTEESFIFEATMDMTDAFQAASFSALHGYYRQAMGSLRGALEVVVAAARFSLDDDRTGLNAFRYGPDPAPFFRFTRDLDRVASHARSQEFAKAMGSRPLLVGRGRTRAGWAWDLYQLLSRYLHTVPGATDGEIWSSNGPIWKPGAFILYIRQLREAFAVSLLVCNLADPDLRLPDTTIELLSAGGEEWLPALLAGFAFLGASG